MRRLFGRVGRNKISMNIMEAVDTIVIIVVMLILSLIGGGVYYVFYYRKEGEECKLEEGGDEFGKYKYDDKKECVLSNCMTGYKLTDGKCISKPKIEDDGPTIEDDGPTIEDDGLTISTCPGIDSLRPRWNTEEVKDYCNKQQGCSWLDNTCKSIAPLSGGTTGVIVPGTSQQTLLTPSQLTGALEGGNNSVPGGFNVSESKAGSSNFVRVETVAVEETQTTQPALFMGGGGK